MVHVSIRPVACLLVLAAAPAAQGFEGLQLTRADIKTLKLLDTQLQCRPIKTTVLVHLTNGSTTLFRRTGGVEIESAAAERDGFWSLRKLADTKPSKGDAWDAGDVLIIDRLLNGPPGRVTIRRNGADVVVVIDDTCRKRTQWYAGIAAWAVKQPGTTHMEIPLNLLRATEGIWASEDFTREEKDYYNRITGDALRALPDTDAFLDKVVDLPALKKFGGICVGESVLHEKKIESKLGSAKPAPAGVVSALDGPFVKRGTTNSLFLVNPVNKIPTLDRHYSVTIEPGFDAVFKAAPGIVLAEKDLKFADSAQIADLLKRDKLEMFLLKDDAALKVTGQQFDKLILEAQSKPKSK